MNQISKIQGIPKGSKEVQQAVFGEGKYCSNYTDQPNGMSFFYKPLVQPLLTVKKLPIQRSSLRIYTKLSH